MSTRRVEFVELLLLLCLVGLFYFFVIPAGIHDPDGFALDQGLPPSFSARLVAVLAAGIVVMRLIRLLLAGKKSSTEKTGTQAPAEIPVDAEPVELSRRVWTGVVISLVFAFGLVPVLGFGIASLLTLALMLYVLGERSRPRLLVFPVLVSAGVWLLFTQILSVRLPEGLLLPMITGS